MAHEKVTIQQLQERKREGKRFGMITVYDYPMASLVEQSDIEVILVGDSLGMVIQGHDSTVPVNLEDIIYHLKCVRRGAPGTFVVGDMPFLSYQVNRDEAIRNAGLLLKAGADCVKMEGGLDVVDTVEAVVRAGIPTMGHIGVTPQTAAMIGGFKVQGKSRDAAQRLLNEAVALERAGVFAIVLECIPAPLGKRINETLTIPVISCGAGPHATGQNLNAYDILGIFQKFVPKFVEQYAQLGNEVIQALNTWGEQIGSGAYPAERHCFTMKEEDVPDAPTI
ncbi:MAG: 3-methyl-2-oxobutanoate hydroxymethyltransferase [Chloroflexota bacterium]